MRRKLAYILVAVAACVPLTTGLLGGQAARASVGPFDMQNINAAEESFQCWIDDSLGAGHPLQMNCSDATDFQLINENIINGTVTWEIADGIGCMNASDADTNVYISSCQAGDSHEEWISTGSTHYWKNVHRGTNGYLNVACSMINPCNNIVVSVSETNPWATPGS